MMKNIAIQCKRKLYSFIKRKEKHSIDDKIFKSNDKRDNLTNEINNPNVPYNHHNQNQTQTNINQEKSQNNTIITLPQNSISIQSQTVNQSSTQYSQYTKNDHDQEVGVGLLRSALLDSGYRGELIEDVIDVVYRTGFKYMGIETEHQVSNSNRTNEISALRFGTGEMIYSAIESDVSNDDYDEHNGRYVDRVQSTETRCKLNPIELQNSQYNSYERNGRFTNTFNNNRKHVPSNEYKEWNSNPEILPGSEPLPSARNINNRTLKSQRSQNEQNQSNQALPSLRPGIHPVVANIQLGSVLFSQLRSIFVQFLGTLESILKFITRNCQIEHDYAEIGNYGSLVLTPIPKVGG